MNLDVNRKEKALLLPLGHGIWLSIEWFTESDSIVNFAEVWSCLGLQEMGQVLAPIIKTFYDIMKCVSTNQIAVSELVSSMASFHKLFKLCWSDEFLQTFERYQTLLHFLYFSSLWSSFRPTKPLWETLLYRFDLEKKIL